MEAKEITFLQEASRESSTEHSPGLSQPYPAVEVVLELPISCFCFFGIMIIGVYHHVQLMWCWESNPGPHACPANILPMINVPSSACLMITKRRELLLATVIEISDAAQYQVMHRMTVNSSTETSCPQG